MTDEHPTIRIDGRTIGGGRRPFVVAEAGTNFRADVVLGKRFVEEAAEAGADAIKFQTLDADRDMARDEMERIGKGELYGNIQANALSRSDHRELKDHCEDHDITFLSTPFSAESVEVLEEIDVPAIKIGSGELTDFHILKTAADTGKPLIVSTGMADEETVARTCNFLDERDVTYALLYCVSLYPTQPSEYNFGAMDRLRQRHDVPVGFSDHAAGTEMAAVAMARGASIVEKHFTLSRRLPGGDQSLSAEPDELSEIASFARLSHEASGDAKPVYEGEQEVAEWARHSVVTATDVGSGETLTEERLTTKRPGTGIPAHRYYDVVGRTVAEDVEEDTVLRERHLDEDLHGNV